MVKFFLKFLEEDFKIGHQFLTGSALKVDLVTGREPTQG